MKKTLGIIAAAGAAILVIGSVLYLAAVLMGGQGKRITFDNGWTLQIGRGGVHFGSSNLEVLDFLDWDDWDDHDDWDNHQNDSHWNTTGSVPAENSDIAFFENSEVNLNGSTSITTNFGNATIPGDVQQIKVNLKITDLDIEQNRGNDITLSWEEISNIGSISYKVENNILIIQESDVEQSILDGLFHADYDRKITLYVPAGFQADFYVDTGLGDVEAENISSGNFTCNIGTGDLDLKNFSTGTLKVSSGTGDVEAENIQFSGESNIVCGLGDIEISGVMSNGLTIENGTGDISISINGKQTDYSYNLATNMGEVRINKQTVSSQYQQTNGSTPLVKAISGMGDISLRTSQ